MAYTYDPAALDVGLNEVRFHHRTRSGDFGISTIAVDDFADGSVCNAELGGNGSVGMASRRIQSAYLPDLIISQQVARVRFSALSVHVSHVVRACSGKQVRGIAAQGRVARVTNMRQVVRYLAVSQEECSAMGFDLSLPSDADLYFAPSASIGGSAPNPTGIRSTGLVNLCPETLLKCWGKIMSHVGLLSGHLPRRGSLITRLGTPLNYTPNRTIVLVSA